MLIRETGQAPPPSRLFQVAILGWIVLAVAVIGKSVISPTNHSNYPNYEYGATRWWSDQNMYDMGKEEIDYRYGPLFAVAISPLVVLPRWLGGLLWTWLNLGAFFWSVRTLVRRALPGTWTPDREGAFLLLVLFGSLESIWSAQVNPLIFALVALGAVAALEERWWLAALLMAIPVHIKVWPLAAALLLSAYYPRKFPWRFALALGALGVVPFLTRPFSVVVWQYSEWFHALFGRAQIRHEYRDAWTIFEVLGISPQRDWYTVLQLGSAALVLALCLWQKRQGAQAGRLLTFLLGMWTAWQMLFGPASERNTFGLIAPMTSWGLLMALESKRGREWMAAAVLLTMVVARWSVERWLLPWLPVVEAAHPLGVLIFAGWLVSYAADRLGAYR